MNKKLNKKLLNLIALCSGITATVAVGIGGIVYSIQEKNSGGGDEPVDQKVLPEEVYEFSEDGKTLLGFQDAFLNDSASPIYKDNFRNCHTMEIPAKVTSINANAFCTYNQSTYQYVTTIPDFINNLTFAEGSNCSSIDHSAFRSCSSLVSADISKANNLTQINQSAFMECSSLTSIDFSSTVTSVDLNVFNDCPSLNSIIWDRWIGSINFISSDAFRGVCPTGGTVTVTNPIGHDSDKLLKFLLDYGGLPQSWAKVNPLPEEVYNIDTNNVLLGFTTEFLANPTAYDMYNTMQIPARVTSIGNLAFYDYADSSSRIPSFITRLTFEENSNCGSIGNNTFQNCSSLTSVNLLNCQNLSSINYSAFSFCSALTSVSFPSSLIEIGWSIFDICPSLNSITWDRWTGSFDFLASDAFSRVCQTSGTVTVINPIDDAHNSAALLAYLKQNSGLPEGWTVS